jgi:DNA-binding MarR family transcriptional regulator
MKTSDQVRSFNRAVTQRIGALDDHFLGRNRPLGEARLLYEIGRQGAEVRELRSKLGLDSGYASRLVSSLESAGLIRTIPALQDKRIRRAQLTAKGVSEFDELDRRSNEAADGLLAGLSHRQQGELLKAMSKVEGLLRAAAVRIERVEPNETGARWCLEQYYAELDELFVEGFDLDRALPTEEDCLVPPGGAFLLATLDDEPVGCGCLKSLEAGVGYLKRMWIAPAARGLGLGRRLLKTLEHQASDLGFEIIRLETNRALVAAQALYRSAGYREIEPFIDEPYADFWFEKQLGD